MPVIVVPKGQTPSERRVALVPDVARRLKAMGAIVRIEKDMGSSAYFRDEDYGDDVSIVADTTPLYTDADIVLTVLPTVADVETMPDGAVILIYK